MRPPPQAARRVSNHAARRRVGRRTVTHAEGQRLVHDAMQVMGAVQHHSLALVVDGADVATIPLGDLLLLCGPEPVTVARGGALADGVALELRRDTPADPFAPK
jgi:hypothetical protein